MLSFSSATLLLPIQKKFSYAFIGKGNCQNSSGIPFDQCGGVAPTRADCEAFADESPDAIGYYYSTVNATLAGDFRCRLVFSAGVVTKNSDCASQTTMNTTDSSNIFWNETKGPIVSADGFCPTDCYKRL